ncbi:MAG TPA: 6-phosphogluconolactonase [bacterium]|nr:6-phosphogluconolactonase [bacterium]
MPAKKKKTKRPQGKPQKPAAKARLKRAPGKAAKAAKPIGFRPEIKRYADAQGLFDEAAHLFLETARQAVAARGRFTAALSGGSTPKGLFQQLAEEPYLSLMPWSKTFLFWVDERHVPFTDETSNFRMTKENLLSKVPLPPENITPGTDPARPVAEAAAWLEGRLKKFFGAGAPPVFDYCLMGMGDDGHTASLFPGMPQLNERDKWVVGYFVDPAKKERVSLTFPVLNAARLLVVLAEGPKKADMLAKVLEGPSDPPRYPIQYLRPTAGRLLFMVDQAAAARLKKK